LGQSQAPQVVQAPRIYCGWGFTT